MDRIYLMGSEDVAKAGYSISHAADAMTRSSNNIDATLTQNQRFMDDWLIRFQRILEDANKM